MRAWTLVLVVALVTAGCVGTDTGPVDDDDSPGSLDEGRVAGPFNVSSTQPGSEPVVDVGPDGTIYVEGVGAIPEAEGETSRNVNRVFRSTDDGETWTDVTPPAVANQSSNDGYVAVGPDGAVYAANVFGLTFQVFKSTDQGDSWTPVNIPRIPALMHRHWIAPLADGEVHVTVEALDPGAATILAGQPSLEGTVDTEVNTGMYYTRSTDGGETWTEPTRIDPQINYVGQSNMVVSQDGEQLYVARYEEDEDQPNAYDYEDGTFYLLASEDGGDTWERRDLVALEGQSGTALTNLALDEDGTLYFTWSEGTDGRAVTQLAVSQDGGGSWQETQIDLSSGTQAMPFAKALAPGRLGVLWYDAHVDGMPGEVDADWHVHYAEVTDAATASPSIEAVRLTGTVHEGNVCVLGPACSGDQDRRLLDYVWVEEGPEGQAHLAWASTMWDQPSAFPVYAQVLETPTESANDG